MFCKNRLYILFLSFLLIDLPLMATDSPSPYANVFDEGIYNQDELQRSFTKSKKKEINEKNEECNYTDLNIEIIQLLIKKKVRYLEERLFSQCDRELEDLKILIEKYKPSNAKKTLKLVGGLLSTATGFSLFPLLPQVGSAKAVFAATSALATIGAISSGLQEFIQPDGQLDLERMTNTIERKKKDLILRINEEPISDLELVYVIRKRFYSAELQNQIEATLLMARIDSFPPLDFKREFLQNCLKLPLQKKAITLKFPWWNLDQNSSHDLSELTEEQRNARNKLTAYHPDIRKKFQEVILKTLISSQAKKPSVSRFYYLWGKPGLGKSTAARELANYLGLPFFETKIRTSDDISERSLEGADWQKEMGNPGHIAQALMKGCRSETGKKHESYKIPTPFLSKYSIPNQMDVQVKIGRDIETYKNTVFIMNDFDRLLLDESASIDLLSFLLDYLDPEKKNFFSPYFKAPLETENLIFFITGNSPIPEDEKFNALRDRVVEIEFKDFLENEQKNLLSFDLNDSCNMYGLNIDAKEKERILDNQKATSSLRKAKASLEGEIIRKMLDNGDNSLIEILHDAEDRRNETEIQELSGSSDEETFHNNSKIDQFYGNKEEEIAFPPNFTKNKISSKVKSLETIRDTVQLLISNEQIDQLKGTRDLLGENGVIHNSWGYIELLWITNSLNSKATAADLNALRNRMNRFETPEQQHEVLRFHIQLVQSITDILLKKIKPDGFIHKKIVESAYRKKNIR